MNAGKPDTPVNWNTQTRAIKGNEKGITYHKGERNNDEDAARGLVIRVDRITKTN